MDSRDDFIIVSRLLHVRVKCPTTNSQTTELRRAADNVVGLLTSALNQIILGRYALPPDAPPIWPFGICIRVLLHSPLNRFTIRIFSLRNREAGLARQYRWRVSDILSLLSWWQHDEQLAIRAGLAEIDINEPGIRAIVKAYTETPPIVFIQARIACR